MKQLRRYLGVLLALIMLFSAAQLNVVAEELEEVKLKIIFLGEPAPETANAFVEMNKLLKEKINATLDPVFLSWADWDQKYPLLFSSGEDFDIIYTADWAFYSEVGSKGGFYPLNMELIEAYCPLSVANLPPEAWMSSALNGQIYMIPQNNFFANHYGLIVRGDLRKKYGMNKIETVDQLEEYMQKIKDEEPEMIPLDISRDNAEMYMRLFVVYEDEHWYLAGEHIGVLTYAFSNPDIFQLDAFYDLPGYEEYLVRVSNWNQKGFLSKSDLISTNAQRFSAGKSAIRIGNLSDALREWQLAKKTHPDWEVEYVNFLSDKKLGSTGYSQGTAFNAKSKHIERALMAVDLLSYDPDLNFMINNGIPGVHAQVKEIVDYEGRHLMKVETLMPGAYGDFSYWNFSNTPTIPVESFDGYVETMLSFFYHQDAHHSLDGFVFDTKEVATEIANTSNILSEYLPIMYLGFSNDPMATLEEFKAKMRDAGIDKVNEEMERQALERFEAAK